MKKRLLGVVLPVLAGIALIGTGFSTWYFTDGLNQQSVGADVKLEGYINIGSIEIADSESYALEIDSSIDDGIRLTNSVTDGETTHTENQIDGISISLSIENGDFSTIDIDKDITLTMDVSIDDGEASEGAGLSDYIYYAVTTGEDDWSLSDSTYTLTIDRSEITTTPDQVTIAVTAPKFTFSYVDDKEPSSIDEWNALHSAVEQATFNITFTASWTD